MTSSVDEILFTGENAINAIFCHLCPRAVTQDNVAVSCTMESPKKCLSLRRYAEFNEIDLDSLL